MRRILLFSSFSTLVITFSFGQSSLHVIGSDGGSVRTDRLALDWTLGEAVTESVSTDRWLMTQGFHQPILTVKPIEPSPELFIYARTTNLEFEVNPNPVKATLHVKVLNPVDWEVSIILTSSNGQTVSENRIDRGATAAEIDMNDFSPGFYTLTLLSPDKSFKRSYSISKIQ